VPTLFTAFSAPSGLAANPAIYGVNSNAFVVKQGDVVEIVINNYDPGSHPFHIHGTEPPIFDSIQYADPSQAMTSR